MKSIRAFAFVVLLPWLAGGGLVAWGYHEYRVLFAPGRNKAKIEQASAAAVVSGDQAKDIQKQAGAVKAAVADVKATHAAEIAARDAADKNAGENIAMVKAALGSEPVPTPAEIVAMGYADAAEIAIGQHFTPEQRAAYVQRVAPLIKDLALAKQAIAQAKIEAAAKDAAIAELRARSVASETTATTAVTQLKSEADAHATVAGQAAALSVDVKAWADKEPDNVARLKALGGLIAVLLILLGWWEVKRRGIAGALQDAVALKEHTEATAVKLGADATALKQSVDSWWSDDPKAKTFFDAVKAKLRL